MTRQGGLRQGEASGFDGVCGDLHGDCVFGVRLALLEAAVLLRSDCDVRDGDAWDHVCAYRG